MKSLCSTLLYTLSLTFIPSAHATYYGCSSTYYVQAHYSQQAFGLEVREVSVHAGVLESIYHGDTQQVEYRWDPTTIVHQQMEKVGDHFFTKFTTGGYRGGGDGAIVTSNLGPRIQYWVFFTNGSSMVSDVIPIGTERATSQKLDNFFKSSDTLNTSSLEVSVGNGCQF
ncbi:MAG: hypothetical protein JST16_12275 [Bdellovibrionales bacterium]|nr:hypothetical protein [Bdellovibrionales bacterium]